MKLLLTGASGFIGRNFLENAPKDMEITAIYNKSSSIKDFIKQKKLANASLHQCDLSDKEQTIGLFKKIGNEFDNCIYLAGNINVPLSIKDPLFDLNSNAGAIINLLHYSKIKRLVYMSSAAVYEGNKGTVTTNSRTEPHIPYSISKLVAEFYVKAFFHSGSVNSYVILRFGGAYGPYSEKKFMTTLVKDIVNGKKEIGIYGDGTNIVNLMYAKDAVNALIHCLKSDKSNITCNFGQDNFTIGEIINKVAKILGKKVSIKYTPKRLDQKYITFELDVDFGKIFNFKPKYSFEEGIKEFGSLLKNEN